MDFTFSFVFLSLLFPPMLLAIQPTLPIAVHVINGNGDTCPADQDRNATQDNIKSTVQSLLQIITRVPACGEGLWKKVASLNMSDPSQQCPLPWREYTSIRSCGRPRRSSGCTPVFFPTSDIQYSKVCGRAIGYQFNSTDGFYRFIHQPTGTPDDNYVDGLSVTHGRLPQKHIWTFAVGLNEPNENSNPDDFRFACPCAAPDDPRFGTRPPSYVGENYFCEAGHFELTPSRDHYSEPLWDGQGCLNSHCCTFNTPPWFSVKLPSPTSDDIVVRICGDESASTNEDTTVGLLEIYVQ